MTDLDLLVQQFVDGELAPEDRVRFIVRLGREEPLRQRLLDLEMLAQDAARLPRPEVPAAFVSDVLARTDDEPARRTLWHRAWEPLPWQWNLASTAAACVALVALGALTTAWLTPAAQATQASVDQASTPPTAPTTFVRLVVVQPGAQVVQVAGDFNGWNPARTSLDMAPDGMWTVTLPLEPGRYQYMLVVDGDRWMADPLAAEYADDGFGARNGVLEVPPPAGVL
jgi:anti-sigma factor RsiW